ncbi:MAG: DHH family phosphoesterase [Longicatena sp.]
MKIKVLDTSKAKEVEDTFDVSSISAKVLAAKGISNEEIASLLKEARLSDPFEANGMREVVERIQLAKEKKQKVLVCGDYDADGICSTTILYDALTRYGITCGFYIPNRFKEGYGLHAHIVEMAHDKGYDLLITVDNGVKAFDALEKARALGVDVIVSDHHAYEGDIPCLYLLHPQLMGKRFSTLSGAGVALEIARAIIGYDKEHVVLACVAAIGDVMSLKEETRDIVKLGISYLKQGYCKPIQMLANDRYPKWDETFIAFQIVPKLNTTGRLADEVNTNNSVRYLLLKNLEEIQNVAKQIIALNDKRKVMSNEMVELAKTLIHPEYKFQLLFHEHFHEGMAGLVAGKLSEEYHQPVMVVAQNEEHFKGSIRSLGFLDLTSFFDDCKSELSAYGGHNAAAGIGFAQTKKQVVQDYVNNKMKDIELQNEKVYEVIQIERSDVSIKAIEDLRELAPFGNGFEEPLFYIPNVLVRDHKQLSDGNHTKWVIDETCEALYFNSKAQYVALKDKETIDFIGNLRINSFMGKKKVNIFVVEAR